MKDTQPPIPYQEFKERYLLTQGSLFEDSFSNPGITNVIEYFQKIESFEIKTGDDLELTKLKLTDYLKRLEIFVNLGYYIQVNLFYELGYLILDKLNSLLSELPKDTILIKGKVFKGKKVYSYINPKSNEISNDIKFDINFGLDQISYDEKFHKTKSYLIEGESYELNLCFLNSVNLTGEPFELYQTLKKKQKTKYTCFLPDTDEHILSLSPELFFERKGNKIVTEPMKGTIPRGLTTFEDEAQKKKLQNSIKDKSENVMITDLFRNDLGKISQIGSVITNELFKIIPIDSVWQMVSQISSEINEEVSILEMIKALFPSGSVTGAPKIRSMELLKNIEGRNRGIYTGSILRWEKENNLQYILGNIAIRTIHLKEKVDATWKGEYGIGSAITVLSDPQEEFAECIAKAKFLKNRPNPDFQILETIRFQNGKFRLLKEHLHRMKDSANRFGYPFSEKKAQECLDKILYQERTGVNPKRIRFLLNENGIFEFQVFPLSISSKKSKIKIWIYPQPLPINDIFLVHKTTVRTLYDEALKKSQEKNMDDTIFLDQEGRVLETAIRNLFVKIGNEWWTPDLYNTGLKGVFRNYIVKKGWAKEKRIYLEELKSASEILLANSVRGFERADLILVT